MRKLLIALLVVSAPLAAQTFNTTTALPTALTDGVGINCTYGAPLNCAVPVSGVSGATSVSINFTFAPAHTWYGDIHCVITSPTGASVLALAASCDGSLDVGSDVGGPYTISDGSPSFDAAANAAVGLIPAGTYAGDNALNALLACGANPNGNWTVTFQDVFQSDTGTLAACSLTFGGAVAGDSFVICQAGPFQPINLTHTGTPGTIYINPALANTPAAVPNGWAFGLDIPYPTFIEEVTIGRPISKNQESTSCRNFSRGAWLKPNWSLEA